MRKKRFLAVLLVVVLCFVFSGVGYGKEFTLEEIREIAYKQKASELDLTILKARTSYIMDNPTDFLNIVFCSYDVGGFIRFDDLREKKLAFYGIINTKGKLVVKIRDNRAAFSDKSGIDLGAIFYKHLVAFLYNSAGLGTFFPYDTHVLAVFYGEEEVPLGYFYQGEYHLWER